MDAAGAKHIGRLQQPRPVGSPERHHLLLVRERCAAGQQHLGALGAHFVPFAFWWASEASNTMRKLMCTFNCSLMLFRCFCSEAIAGLAGATPTASLSCSRGGGLVGSMLVLLTCAQWCRRDGLAAFIQRPKGNYEDPFLYTDERGWHLLYHVYSTTENPPHGHECVNATVSAHAFSLDGYDWHMSPLSPYGTQVQLTSGGVMTVATRERPKMWFNSTGHKTHLFNGVCGAANCPNGPKTGCVDCKYANWDFTLVQPLDV